MISLNAAPLRLTQVYYKGSYIPARSGPRPSSGQSSLRKIKVYSGPGYRQFFNFRVTVNRVGVMYFKNDLGPLSTDLRLGVGEEDRGFVGVAVR